MTPSETPPLIPRRVLFGNPDKASTQISPDGRQLSYLAPVNGVLNVWVGSIDNPAAAQPLTQDTGQGHSRHIRALSGRGARVCQARKQPVIQCHYRSVFVPVLGRAI